jgi:hypothetical protein
LRYDLDGGVGDPLIIDPNNLNFTVSNDSPAITRGFENIPQNFGVYNTDDDISWELSALREPAPLIYGNANWADFETIPYPYNPLVEYQ